MNLISTLSTLIYILAVISTCQAITQRRIYTLFTNTKTWNEASAICNSQFGQLVKVQSHRHIDELEHLDSTEWGNQMSNAAPFWTGLHQPFSMNNTWEYQDCEAMSSSIPFSNALSGAKCATLDGVNDLSEANCSTEHIFVCQRYEGDCWYEPFIGETYTAPIYQTQTLSTGLEASDCAMECRSGIITPDIECWGFIYDPSGSQGCELLFLNEISASSTFLTTGKNYSADPDMIFYVRRCFEGSLDKKTYDSFSNKEEVPETECTTALYGGEETAAQVCFCSTQEHPPIPEPVSVEEKAQKYIEELTIDTSNTSAAINKLTSAEDNRPSAVGVGFVGVGLLSAIFGGLVLMDLNVLYAGLKEFFKLICDNPNPQSPQSTETPVETNC
ncbi:uncharacterized protein LOC132720962 [Ruditapes philippinarum]|uniref:uncharacterized protein LOC132720962 n=1 Tax=Ruditapes philippinarum TaxID=129788 RepID=UPI00295B38EF|nr:uncharacterized protein LOC132720962 [Ruditapes philippinarum]